MACCTLIQEHFVEKKQQKMGKTTAAGYALSRVSKAKDFIEEIEHFKKDLLPFR
jgi:hypothetical protein